MNYNYYIANGNLISGVPIMRRVGTQTLHVSTIGELATAMQCWRLIGETTHLAIAPEIHEYISNGQVSILDDHWSRFKRPTDSDSDSDGMDDSWEGP